MEKDGKKNASTWHGKTASLEQIIPVLSTLSPTKEQEKLLNNFRKTIRFVPKRTHIPAVLSKEKTHTGSPLEYDAKTLTDCRTAYGKALADLAKHNKHIVALTADVSESVKTHYLKNAYPNRHIECGIAEQHMLSCAGGLSLAGFTPFASTFGVFMTSRAKDQMRVNDINQTNVKMVATHCGISVGEDGPTHQAIEDAGSTLGLLHTLQMEPADPNHCDRIIRYAASRYGNMYIRMGRHQIPVLTKEDGSIFYDKHYQYHYGKCDVLRTGTDLTIVAIGSTSIEALRAYEQLKKESIFAEIIIASSIKEFDESLFTSILKTKKILTVEDHTTRSGLGSQIAKNLVEHRIHIDSFNMLGVDKYQLSGTAQELYATAGIDANSIYQTARSLIGTPTSARI